ncbi:MAG: RecB family exonuclease [Myxococcota bacterium]
MAIRHELSWSASRAKTFDACRRQYYYTYYLSWGGWKRSAPEVRQRAWVLKKMTRMPMLSGSIVHEALEGWLRGRMEGRTAEAGDVVTWAERELRTRYRVSRDGEWRRRPARLTHLAEHHYGEPRIDEASGAAADYGKTHLERIRRCLEGFFEARDERLAAVHDAHPSEYVAVEDMSTFDVAGTRVFAVPDFAVRDADGLVHIYDWKTGRPREADAFQLAGYALYATRHWGVDAEQVRCHAAYLGDGDVRSDAFTASDLHEAEQAIVASIGEMAPLHFDADRHAGDRADFPMIPEDSPARRACGRCNFRELCDRA